MSDLSLNLLGPFQARLDGNELSGFRTSKVQALLVYLTTEREPHGREKLMELLWPGMPERSARHNLRQVLYYLRGAIPELSSDERGDAATVPVVLANRQTIQLNPAAGVTADVHRFDELLESSRDHAHLDLLSCPVCHDYLEEAVALYQGEFLADFYLDDSNTFEEWAQVIRESYRRRTLDALEILTGMVKRKQDYRQARALAERQLEIDNLRESSYRQLMEVLALSGHREEALAVYERCRRILAEELGMRPARRTTEVYERILAGELSFDTPVTYGLRGYEIKDEIGKGMYGTIHRAYQPVIGREVAVKVIHRTYANDPEFVRRFEDEAQTIARLEHPFIVPLYDYWRDPDGAYLVMRYLKGGSLLTQLEHGPWELPATVQMLHQIASALSAAHAMNIVHRDIKPANILLDEDGNAFLSDFGIATSLDGTHVPASAAVEPVTADYVSPEQILDEPVGPTSDQYSLGAVLFETLTGEKPFSDTSMANRLYKHLHEPFPLVCDSRPDLPPEVDTVIRKATAKRPADRYANVMDFADAFGRVSLGVEVVDAPYVSLPGPHGSELQNPYKGLQAFQEEDSEVFFGRDTLVDELIVRLSAEDPDTGDTNLPGSDRFLALVGPSGSGKSSVVKAGLLPALRSGALPNAEKWFFAEMVPGTHPLEELELALWPIAVDAPPSLVEPMERDIRGMLRTIRRIMPDEEGAQLLLVIDQFEELFTLVEDEHRRSFFLESLLVALSAPRSPLHVIMTIRADFYDRPLQLQSFGRLLKNHTQVVLPLTADELTWAIREPARRQGIGLETGLTETIVADVIDQPGALPLLQYALTELFDRRQGNQMTLADYREIGGVNGALGLRADELYDGLSPVAQEASRHLFLRLVTVGESMEVTRRRAPRAELERIGEAPMAGIIDAFGAARLLTFDRDPVSRAPTVEVAHEALLREWPRLRRWLEESRDDVRRQRQLARAAREWQESGKEEGYLLRGAHLAQIEPWAADDRILLTHEERDFLLTSIAAREAREAAEAARQQRELEAARRLAATEQARAESEAQRATEQASAAKRLRRRAYALAGVLSLAILLAATAVVFGRNANQQTLLAQSRELAASSTIALDTDPELGVLLAMEALSTADTDQARQALHSSLLASRVRQRLVGHESAIQRLAYSPDGSLIALASHSEELATVWDADAGRKLHDIPVAQCCWGLYFDEGGQRLAAAGRGGRFNLAIWDVVSGELVENFPLPVPASEVAGYYLRPGWEDVALYLTDGTLSVWDLQAGIQLFALPAHTGAENVELEYSKNGTRLVSYSVPDGLVVAWDADTGEVIRRLETGAFINDHAVSPDGSRVALAVDTWPRRGWDVQIWDIDKPTGDSAVAGPSARLTGHEQTIRLIDFSADGRMVASASRDGTSHIWDSSTGELLLVLPHGTHVRSVVFHPDGTRLASSDLEGVTRIWDITREGAAERLGVVAHDAPMNDVALSPNGAVAATSSVDGSVTLWNIASGTATHQLDGHTAGVSRVAFHPEGRQLATAGEDGTIRVWDVATGGELLRFGDQGGEGRSDAGVFGFANLDYSPDGSRLATAGQDGTTRVWDSANGEQIVVLEEHPVEIKSVAYSPDGRYLATGTASGQDFNVAARNLVVRVWDTQTNRELFALSTGHEDTVWNLAFTSDNHFLVSVSGDGTARVWALDFVANSAELVTTLSNHASGVVGVGFSPDGRLLGTAGGDELRLWDFGPLVDNNADGSISELLVLPGGSNVAFSPDGYELVTGSREGIMRVYVLDPDELLAFAKTRLTRWWVDSECSQYLHTDSCPPAP